MSVLRERRDARANGPRGFYLYTQGACDVRLLDMQKFAVNEKENSRKSIVVFPDIFFASLSALFYFNWYLLIAEYFAFRTLLYSFFRHS